MRKINKWFDEQSVLCRYAMICGVMIPLAFLGGVVSRLTHSDLGLLVYFGGAGLLIWMRKL
jgi:hypothetical protein